MSDFKAPDVVWIDKETLTVIQDCKSTTNGHIGIPDTSEVDVKLGDPAVYPAKLRDRQTLTTSVEKNTRKAVREAIERIIVSVTKAQSEAEKLRVVYQDEGDEEEAYNMVGHETAYDLTLDMLNAHLAQYQEVAS